MITSTLVVVPTYNEKDSLPDTITRLRANAPAADILIVDDNSPDGTGQIADDLCGQLAGVFVSHRAAKNGLGAAYLEGFAWALSQGYDAIVECDADGSHRPEDLPRLLAALEHSDMVLGSRWIAGGEVVDWPRSRELLSRGGSFYARTLLRLKQRDVTSGFRAFRSSALVAIDLSQVTSQGYCFQIEMLWRAHRAGLAIDEVPISFSERRWGVSKMRGRIVLEAMARVTLWGATDIFRLSRISKSSRVPSHV